MGRKFRHHHIPWSKGINPGKTTSKHSSSTKRIKGQSRNPVSVRHKVASEPGEEIIMIDVYKKIFAWWCDSTCSKPSGYSLAVPPNIPRIRVKNRRWTPGRRRICGRANVRSFGEAPMGLPSVDTDLLLMGNESHDLMLTVENLILPDLYRFEALGI